MILFPMILAPSIKCVTVLRIYHEIVLNMLDSLGKMAAGSKVTHI